MKHNILLASLMTAAALGASAQVDVESQVLSVDGKRLTVEMDMDLDNLGLNSRQALIISPYLSCGNDTLWLDKVGVYGRTQYIQHQRGNNRSIPAPAIAFKASQAPASYHYTATAEMQPWMEGAQLRVMYTRYGCAGCGDAPQVVDGIALLKAPVMPALDPLMVYVEPGVDTVKVRHLEGRANVEFPVNKTTLLEDFRGNYAELSRVRASIDSVRNDKDVSIRSMTIKGYASPEGSYTNNTRLAKGRTEALKRYVDNLYSFPPRLVTTDYRPEDWDGLRQWVESSNISHRDGILAIIDDTTLDPDSRDAKIKRLYPTEYSTLLATVYPSLRHTDYRIQYTVRAYSDPAEIRRVMETRPGNLSLNEFFILARTYTPGSPEYNRVFETAVSMYPDDPVANLNAAGPALAAGDIRAAERYLSKAGDSPQATYDRGVLALLKGDYTTATELLGKAHTAGIGQSQTLLDYIDRYLTYARSRGIDTK